MPYIPATFRIIAFGIDEAKNRGFVVLGEKFVGKNGEYTAQTMPLLNFWVTKRNSKSRTPVAESLKRLDGSNHGDVLLEGIDYSYSRRNIAENGAPARWVENHNLVAINKVVNRGVDVAHDDDDLPNSTPEIKETTNAKDKAERNARICKATEEAKQTK